MANKIFSNRINNQIEFFLNEAEGCNLINHSGMKGYLRQIFVEKLLEPLLPEGIHIGTGKITDSSGNLSNETDIILFDKRSVPPILYDQKMGVFPIECVYYAIEVKSKLTDQEFTKAIENGIVLRKLEGIQPHSVLFAYASDLTIKNDSERFIQVQKDMKVPLPLNIFCVVGREYGFWNKEWKVYPAEKRTETIAAFLVGIMNTLVQSVHFRKPSIEPGRYYFPENYDNSRM